MSPISAKQFVRDAKTALQHLYGEDEAGAMALRLLLDSCAMPRHRYVADGDKPLGEEVLRLLKSRLAELEKGAPLQYVLGFTEFCGHRFKVGPGVLIPRPETEELAASVISAFEERELSDDEEFTILDMCTGSGCLAWSLAAALPGAVVYGCDISDEALRYACRQKIKCDSSRPVFFKADILQPPPAGLPKFSLIVANPPYVMESELERMRPNVLDFEPSEALFVPDSDPLLHYRAIARWAASLLGEGGEIWLEINEALGAPTAAIFTPEEGWDRPGTRAEIRKDIFGKERFVRIW